ncbi:CD5 antigen-like [Ambystoma mexicanum]|uniref:CD5 antigen-like n=1 Tax=Ambystoma mexicanum TaxID=8296 RepID=UPI0037E76A1F
MLSLLPLLVASCLGVAISETQFSVRLKGGTACSGRVEIYVDESWGNVCDDGWSLNAANVVCRQLGCGPAQEAYSSPKFGPGLASDPILISELYCSGQEHSLGECNYKREDTCDHDEDAGVGCAEKYLGIRLVNGPNKCSGRLEVNYNGQWGTVCNDRWDMLDTKVACKELGCSRPISANKCEAFGKGSGPIWLNEVICTGQESTLSECKANTLGAHDCTHAEDVGIECMEPFEVRLADGPNRCSGRLEVFFKHEWGTVCNDDWDLNDAKVVCRELACGHPEHRKALKPMAGMASGRIWLDDVACHGSETSLENCKHRIWGFHDCTHAEDVTVTCTGVQDP